MSELLIATRNRGKQREFAHIFADVDLQLCTLDDLGIDVDVEETGATFRANAALKAQAYCQLSGRPTLADDSGLEVDALHGQPGVYSARYGGRTGAAQLAYLLQQLEGVPAEARQARFVCVIALARPGGPIEFAEGFLSGMITHEPRGSAGFGYDPLFYLPELGQTLAELSPVQKNVLSHRAAAAQAARAILMRWQTEGVL